MVNTEKGGVLELYTIKDIVPILTFAVKPPIPPKTRLEKASFEAKIKRAKTGYGGDKFYESEKTVMHRVIGLVEKGIITPDRIDGTGHSSTRYYTNSTDIYHK